MGKKQKKYKGPGSPEWATNYGYNPASYYGGNQEEILADALKRLKACARCGHIRAWHHDHRTRRCTKCDCPAFVKPKKQKKTAPGPLPDPVGQVADEGKSVLGDGPAADQLRASQALRRAEADRLLAEFEAEHGPIAEDEMQELHRWLGLDGYGEVKALREQVDTLTEALAFYADPATYEGISFSLISMAGVPRARNTGFMGDFGKVYGSPLHTSAKAGARARAALAAVWDAQVAEQVDAPGSNPGSLQGSEGSSPSLGTEERLELAETVIGKLIGPSPDTDSDALSPLLPEFTDEERGLIDRVLGRQWFVCGCGARFWRPEGGFTQHCPFSASAHGADK